MPYHIGYATSNRAGCKGPKPCAGTKILKGELRLGTLVEIQGSQSFSYRHFGCITPKIIRNIQEKDGITDPADLSGYEDLIPEDQARVARAFADGHVASEDIPDSARYAAADEADKAAAEAAILSPTSSASSEKSAKKRGRPSKSSLEAAAAAAAAETSYQPAPVATAPNGASVQPAKDKKKPGRPRKDAAAAQPAGVPPAPVVPSPVPVPVTTPDAPAAKKRGRPPKDAAAAPAAPAPVPVPVPVPAAPVVPQPEAAALPQKKRGRPSKASLEAAAAATAVAAAAQPAPAPTAPVAPYASAQASPKKRGRPPKNATAAAPAPAAPVPVPVPAPAPVPAAPAAPVTKKRGRPSKASLEAAAVAAAGNASSPAARPPSDIASNGPGLPIGLTFGVFANDPSPPPGWAPAAPIPSRKKRGRPPKNAATAIQPAYQASGAPMAPSTPVAAPAKKRGRPKKNADPAAADAASLSQVTTPPLPRTPMPLQLPVQASPSDVAAPSSSGKKRGRPPKEKVEGEEAVKRPRGRPKKVDGAAAPAPVAHPGQTASAAPGKKPRGRPKKNT